MNRAAYERGRSDAAACAHVRSNNEDYLRGYAERIAGIPGAQSLEVHLARSDAWAGRPPSRTDAVFLTAYAREIQDCLNRACHRQEDLERAEGLRDAVQRIPPKSTHVPAYLRGYAEAAAVLLAVPTPAPKAPLAPAPNGASRFSQLEVE